MGKPTPIRELLIPPFSQNQATALAERVEAVLKLHQPNTINGVPINCLVCRCGDGTRARWPCPTICVLNGEA